MVKKHLKISKTILIWFILTAVWNIAAPYVVFPVVGRIGNISSYSYSLLILFWAFSLKKEIPDPFVLLRLRLGGFFWLKHTDDNEAFIEGRFIDDRYELVLSGTKREVTPSAETEVGQGTYLCPTIM